MVIASRKPVNTAVTMCGNIDIAQLLQARRAHGVGAAHQQRIDVAHAGDGVDDHRETRRG